MSKIADTNPRRLIQEVEACSRVEEQKFSYHEETSTTAHQVLEASFWGGGLGLNCYSPLE